jgi:hypothetical protein
LQELSKDRAVRVSAVHQPRDIFKAHVSVLQFLVIEHPKPSLAGDVMSLKGEVHFFDPMTLGRRPELRFRPLRSAAKEYVVFFIHNIPSLTFIAPHEEKLLPHTGKLIG